MRQLLRYCLLSLLLATCIINLNINCSYAVLSQQDVEDYLTYYKTEIDNGSTEWVNTGLMNNFYDIYINSYNQFSWVCQNVGTNVPTNITLAGFFGSWGKNIILGSKYSMNSTNYSLYQNYKTQYNPSSNMWTQSSPNSIDSLLYTQVLVLSTEGFTDNEVQLMLSQNTMCQKQWTYALARDPSGIRYINGNNWVTAFDIRIGQDWDINNFDINIYTLDSSNNKTYRNNIVRRFTQATGSSEYIVDFDTSNLDSDNTYYIELKYQGNIWRVSNGQRIKNGFGTNSGDNSGGGSNIDFSITNGLINSVDNHIVDQTQVIISGDEAIKEAINQLESGNIERDNFWRNTYNDLFTLNSGDTNEIYAMVSSYFPSGDTPLTIYDTIFGSMNNSPTDFIITWDDVPLNITWFNGQTLYSGDFIKAGSMNFSKECRDNDTLRLIKFWANTFIMFFTLLGYFNLLYKLFLDCLGVINEGIETEPEHNPIGFIPGGR